MSFAGRFYTLDDALCEPKAVQRPHPPIVIGGAKPKMLRVVARHANEWNMVGESPQEWAETSARLDNACAEVGRIPRDSSIRPVVPASQAGRSDRRAARPAARVRELGCEHAVLSFYQPPSTELLERCANLNG